VTRVPLLFAGHARPILSPRRILSGESGGFGTGAAVFFARLLTALTLTLMPGCATVYRAPAPGPLGHQKALEILSGMRDQDKRVTSFYSLGNLHVKKWYGGSEADILVAGTRGPLRIKIEITHPWGRPILHILIDRNKLRILSFEEKRFYVGPFSTEALSRFLPGDLNADLIWAVLRGYPGLLNHQRMISRKTNQIILLNDRAEEVEIIDLRDEDLSPITVHFPVQGVRLAFEDYRNVGGIRHAGEVRVDQGKEKKGLTLKSKRMVFNRAIPNEIFSLEKPPAFQTVFLNGKR
jgi:hypothetical protein